MGDPSQIEAFDVESEVVAVERVRCADVGKARFAVIPVTRMLAPHASVNASMRQFYPAVTAFARGF
jgi:hypothetical protein